MKPFLKLSIILVVLLTGCQRQPDTLFRLIPAGESGIAFNNRIIESDSLNMLDYEYTYNGGGVAVADFNNDGWQDLYFVGNKVKNRLYLNRKNMQFRDVTEAAKAGGSSQWHTGVSAVDINNDEWIDIYLSVAHSKNAKKRANILLINQGLNAKGIPVFANRAEEYGLASHSFSTQSAFFDYDNDGDLDMYEIVADKRPKGRQNVRQSHEEERSLNTDNLFQNKWDSTRGHPYYTEVSAQAGIVKDGYGLGLNIVDINRDGWKDIYVSNDFVSNDLLWINNGDGTFSDKAGRYFKHTSFSGMGTDVADINNDGRMDFITLDMAGSNNIHKQTMTSPNNYQNYFNNIFKNSDPQYTRNTLQFNQGLSPGEGSDSHPVFSEIALLSGVAETDWSWGVLMADFNHDRFNDMVITNGIPRNKIDKDFVRLRDQISNIAPKSMLLDSIPRDKSANVSFINNGNLTFNNSSQKWGLDKKAYSTALAWGDLDKDGDLDLVMNNINDRAFIYQNSLDKKPERLQWLKVRFEGSKKNKQGIGAIVDIYKDSLQQTAEYAPYRGYLSTVEGMVHFGLGEISELDSLIVRWNKSKQQVWKNVQANQTLIARYTEASKPQKRDNHRSEHVQTPVFQDVTKNRKVDFKHNEKHYADFKIQRMLPYKLSQFGPSLAVGDIDGDDLQDIYVGGSFMEQGVFLLQKKDGSFREQSFSSSNKNRNHEDAGALFFDVDKDGDQDLYIASGSVENAPNSSAYEDRFYENNGKGDFTYRPEALSLPAVSSSAVKAADYDQDGDLDLFIGGRMLPHFYPVSVSSYILRNDTENGVIQFTDVSNAMAPMLQDIGLVTDALWTDFNNDGWQDLVIAGEWMPITFLQNKKGRFKSRPQPGAIGKAAGLWNSLAGGDFDNDGDTDYIAANLGLNTIYETSKSQPVRIYADDFDNNGAYDAVITSFTTDSMGEKKEFPVDKFEDFRWQLPRKAQQISTVEKYANATIQDLFTEKELAEALISQVNELQTSYIENKGNGRFSLTPLPIETQFAPIFGMVVDDVTGDGNLDVILNGNLFRAEVQVGRYDAFNGLLLKGNGKGSFKPVETAQSGIYIPGDGKSLVKLYSGEKKYLLAASQNEGALKVFDHQVEQQVLVPNAMDAYAIFHFKNEKKQKQEFYYGSSFQSASGRFVVVPENAISASIVTYTGSKRKVEF